MDRLETKARNLPALTGIRGAAALWVFLHHWNLFVFGTGQGDHVLAVGYLAVDMFFILSGFVMTHSRYEQFNRRDLGEYATFLAERFMRLYPTNAAVIVIYAVAVTLMPAVMLHDPAASFTVTGLLSAITLTNAWPIVGGAGWIAPSWSVSLEILAYLALPMVLLAVRRMSARWAIVVAVACVVVFMAAVMANGDHDPNVKNRGALIRLAAEFLPGAALCRFWRLGGRVPGALGSVVALVLLTIALNASRPEVTFLALPAFALIVLLAAQGKGAMARALSGRVSMFLGRISYSLYLVHWPALVVFREFGGLQAGFVAGCFFAGTVLALATAVHYAVEAPSHRLAKRLFSFNHQSRPLSHPQAAR